jgi:PQQ-like domain
VRAIQVKCPNCAAIVRAGAEADVVECEYCHTQSTVQRRTRMLQIPVRMPAVRSAGPPPGRVARQVVRRAVLGLSLLTVLFPLFIVAVVLYSLKDHFGDAAGAVSSLISQSASTSTTANPGLAGQATWVGLGPPLVAKVDGDEVADVIGYVRYVHDGDRAHVTARSGATGEPVWQSERLGTYSDTVQARLAVMDDVVLFAGATGQLVGLGLRDGRQRFAASLPDAPKRLCRAGDAAVAIETADGKRHEIALADGALRRAPGKRRCERIRDDEHRDVDPALTVDSSPRRWKQPGMQVSRELRLGSSGPVLAVGYRRPGTAVPMVARLDERGRPAWKMEVPDGNPLQARQGVGLWTATEKRACATYERTGAKTQVRITCFAIEDGARAWDIEIPGERMTVLTSLIAAGERLYLSGWGLLLGIDAATGKWVPGFAP